MGTWNTDTRPGYRSKVVQYDDCEIVVHRPIQSNTERAKQEQRLQHTLANLKIRKEST